MERRRAQQMYASKRGGTKGQWFHVLLSLYTRRWVRLSCWEAERTRLAAAVVVLLTNKLQGGLLSLRVAL